MITGDKDNGNLNTANESNPQSVSQAVPNGTEGNESTGLRYRLPGSRAEATGSNGNIAEVQRDLRPGSPGTVDLSDFQPGAKQTNETQSVHPLLQEIEASINEADAIIDEADIAIVDDLATDILDAENIIQEASIAVLGEPELVISDAEKVIDKVKAKLLLEIEDDLREAYSYMSSIGIPVPTDEEIAYAEATGNYTDLLGINTGSQPAIGSVGSILPGGIGGTNPQEQVPTSQPTAPIQTPMTTPVGGARDEPIHTGSEGCHNSFGPEASTVGAYGALEACNNTSRCAVEVQSWYEEFRPETAIAFQSVANGMLAGPVRPLPYTPENMQLLGEGNFQVQYAISWSGNTGSWWGAINGPIGSYNGPAQMVLIPIGYHLQIDPTTGDVWAVKFNRPDWCGLQQFCSDFCEHDDTSGTPTGEDTGGKCEPPKKPDCPTDAKPGNIVQGGPANTSEHCDQLKALVEAFSGKDFEFSKLIGMGTSTIGIGVALEVVRAVTGVDAAIVPGLLNRFAKWVDELIKQMATVGDCDRTAMIPLSMNNAAMSFVQKWAAIIPPQYMELMRQVANTACQSFMPNGQGANVAWLSDEINNDTWECWQKLQGNIIDAAAKVAHAERTRPNARELNILFRRKKLDEKEYHKRIRAAGVVENDDRISIQDLNEHWPAQSEIIRLMNRDVFNKDTVEKSKLFDGFEDNYNGKAEEYGEALGIDKELMKLYYGAHWQLPSYTMAKEFFYRFGHGDVPENLRFTESDFRQLLKQDDWSPGHIDRMIAASLHPITRTDAVRAYMIHVSEDEELIDQLMKTGYARDTAEFMQRFYKKRREINDRKASGYPTLRTAVNAYARCELAESEFTQIVSDITIDDDQSQAAIKAAKVSRKVWERKQTIRTVKRPYLLGIYDVSQATQELSDAKVDPSCVDDLIKQWNREMLRRDKYLTAGQLCDMYEKGLIGPEQYLISLVRTGWSREDASLIVEQCGIKISEKLAAKLRREAEKAARLLKQQQREAEKAARLAECGPPPCPANRQQSNRPAVVGQ